MGLLNAKGLYISIDVHSSKGDKMALETNNPNVEVNDPYNSKKCYEGSAKQRCKNKGLSDESDLWIMRRCLDLEKGKNLTGKKKGKPRSYRYINTHQQKLIRLAMIGEEQYNKSIIKLSEDDIVNILDDMRNNKIKKLRQKNGTMEYKAVDNFAVHFKAFWHWYMKYNKKVNNKQVYDITEDLDTSNDREPEFVYFTFDSLKTMAEEAKYNYKVLMYFLFDSGMRVTEAMNIKAKDFSEDEKTGKLQVNIRTETSKTFGRKIKLMLCSDIIKRYLKKGKFKKEDYVMNIATPRLINKYLLRLSERVFSKGLEELKENKGNKNLTMYDFRHSSACYWLPRYQTEAVLKYRFGWKNSSMIHYYTKFLGMEDTISEEDMLIDTTKTELQKQLEVEKQQRIILEEKLEQQMADIPNMIKRILKDNPPVEKVKEELKSRSSKTS